MTMTQKPNLRQSTRAAEHVGQNENALFAAGFLYAGGDFLSEFADVLIKVNRDGNNLLRPAHHDKLGGFDGNFPQLAVPNDNDSDHGVISTGWVKTQSVA
jgi:hypothetical protein